MKIICINEYNNVLEISLKPDTAMLINNKPLFVPHFTEDIRYTPCKLLRICKLGRNIDQKFASRYFDAQTIGLDFVAFDKLTMARNNASSQSVWRGFDGSMAIGKWNQETPKYRLLINNQSTELGNEYCCSDQAAIALVSQFYKLGTGDIVAIAIKNTLFKARINDRIEIINEQNDSLLAMNIK